MSYSDKLYDYYLELARLPCSQSSFAGSDMRFSGEYEVLESEIGKAQSMHGTGQPDWDKVLQISESVLRQQSKDLRVAVWLTWALHQRESFPGLLAAWVCCAVSASSIGLRSTRKKHAPVAQRSVGWYCALNRCLPKTYRCRASNPYFNACLNTWCVSMSCGLST